MSNKISYYCKQVAIFPVSWKHAFPWIVYIRESFKWFFFCLFQLSTKLCCLSFGKRNYSAVVENLLEIFVNVIWTYVCNEKDNSTKHTTWKQNVIIFRLICQRNWIPSGTTYKLQNIEQCWSTNEHVQKIYYFPSPTKTTIVVINITSFIFFNCSKLKWEQKNVGQLPWMFRLVFIWMT